jgi:hypothetical protein
MKTLKVKTIVLIAAIGLISYGAMAQQTGKDVPPAVVKEFSTKYPAAQLKSWKAKDNAYIASFVMDNKVYEATYSGDGAWINTERTIRHISSLPEGAKLYLKNGYFASWHIDNMERVRTPMQNMYEVEVDNNSGNQMVYENAGSVEDKMLCFNDEGRLIKTINK